MSIISTNELDGKFDMVDCPHKKQGQKGGEF